MSLLRTPRQLVVTVTAIFAAAASYLLLTPYALPTATATQAAEERWALSQAVSIASDDALSVINAQRLFGAAGLPSGLPSKPDDEPPLTPPDWRIVGSVIFGPQRLLLVSTAPAVLAPMPRAGGPGLGLPPQPPKALRVGDTLPGGARILEIRANGVCLSLKGRQVFLSTTPQ